jgi:hypothetical protein
MGMHTHALCGSEVATSVCLSLHTRVVCPHFFCWGLSIAYNVVGMEPPVYCLRPLCTAASGTLRLTPTVVFEA